MSLNGTVVPGAGNRRARWAIVGEAPGEVEALRGEPFVGKTGEEQDAHLARNGLNRRNGWLTNLRKTYVAGNPSPTPEEVEEWGPKLLAELRSVSPSIIMSAGYHSTAFLLGYPAGPYGSGCHLEAIHGMPQRSPFLGDTVIMPSYHPAAHFYQPDLLPHITWDYARFAAAVRNEIPTAPIVDAYHSPVYLDLGAMSMPQIDAWVEAIDDVLSIDTEGVPGDEWSVQFSIAPGTGIVARRETPWFKYFLRRLGEKARTRNPVLVIHSALYDIEMCRGLGLDLLDLHSYGCPFFDTMMAAYLMCLEPQSLKMLAKRWAGMEMADYMETVGDIGIEKQINYLIEILQYEWPKPEARVEWENDGSCRVYTPQPVGKRAEAIIRDVSSGKLDKEGDPTDPRKRWRKVDRQLRRMVESVLGPMPLGTLADILLDKAVYYSGRDPDATLRVYSHLKPALEAQGLTSLMDMKMAMLPAAAEMKMNGIAARKTSFEDLSERLWNEMLGLVEKLSREHFGGQLINPGSADQVATLMRRRGLKGEKKTKTGKMSTSKKSIEHLRYTDDAIEIVEEWREKQKARDSFCEPPLENWPEGADMVRVKTDLKITRVSSGRFSATIIPDQVSVPLLAIPVRKDIGKAIRNCYEAEEGYELGSWDLDQAEMRVMADESRDESLLKIFNEGKIDVHTDTAARVFAHSHRITYEELDRDKKLRTLLRDPAKRANFGVITGIQGQGLYDQLRMAGATGWTVKKCEQLIDDIMELRPGVKRYMKQCHRECRENGGIIRDRWGMMRYLPAIFSDDKYERLEAERQTHSHKIQGGAQGMLQNTMGWLYPQLRLYGDTVRWIIQIHDAIMLEVRTELKSDISKLMMDGMVNHGAKLLVPVRSSENWSTKWGSMKD